MSKLNANLFIVVMMNRTLLIIGGESTALEIRETAELLGFYQLIHNVVANSEICRYSFIRDSELDGFLSTHSNVYYIVGMANVPLKQKYVSILSSHNANPSNVIHPNTYISPSADMGLGNYLAWGSVVSSEVCIGNHNLINYNVTIGHNSAIGNNNAFNPGSKIGGHVQIGDNCLIGANSFILQGISICSDCKIDAMTYVGVKLEVPSICSSNIGMKKYRNIFIKKTE